MNASTSRKPALRLVEGEFGAPAEWTWFCGHCAAPPPGGAAPAPAARVCAACGLGLLLECRKETIPGPRDAFLVVDSALMVQAMSRQAEQLLAVTEDLAVNRPVANLLVPADAEAGSRSFAGAIVAAVGGGDGPVHPFLRPWNTFGVRLRARIGSCGPPRAALLVLEAAPPTLRAVEDH